MNLDKSKIESYFYDFTDNEFSIKINEGIDFMQISLYSAKDVDNTSIIISDIYESINRLSQEFFIISSKFDINDTIYIEIKICENFKNNDFLNIHVANRNDKLKLYISDIKIIINNNIDIINNEIVNDVKNLFKVVINGRLKNGEFIKLTLDKIDNKKFRNKNIHYEISIEEVENFFTKLSEKINMKLI